MEFYIPGCISSYLNTQNYQTGKYVFFDNYIQRLGFYLLKPYFEKVFSRKDLNAISSSSNGKSLFL